MSEPQPYDSPLPGMPAADDADRPAEGATGPAWGVGYTIVIRQRIGGVPAASIACDRCSWLREFELGLEAGAGIQFSAIAPWLEHAASEHPA